MPSSSARAWGGLPWGTPWPGRAGRSCSARRDGPTRPTTRPCGVISPSASSRSRRIPAPDTGTSWPAPGATRRRSPTPPAPGSGASSRSSGRGRGGPAPCTAWPWSGSSRPTSPRGATSRRGGLDAAGGLADRLRRPGPPLRGGRAALPRPRPGRPVPGRSPGRAAGDRAAAEPRRRGPPRLLRRQGPARLPTAAGVRVRPGLPLLPGLPLRPRVQERRRPGLPPAGVGAPRRRVARTVRGHGPGSLAGGGHGSAVPVSGPGTDPAGRRGGAGGRRWRRPGCCWLRPRPRGPPGWPMPRAWSAVT